MPSLCCVTLNLSFSDQTTYSAHSRKHLAFTGGKGIAIMHNRNIITNRKRIHNHHSRYMSVIAAVLDIPGILRRTDQRILELLYPLHCPVCDRVAPAGRRICGSCMPELFYVQEPACRRCGKPITDIRKEFCTDCSKKHAMALTQGKAVWIYEGPIVQSLYRFKYQNRREYARAYAQEIALRYGAWICARKVEALIPVPLHRNRKKSRGYNQAECVAAELGRILELPVRTDILRRVTDTAAQKTLDRKERKNNLKKAFKTTQNIVQLRKVLVIDDIYTTGTTVDAVASVLHRAGVAEVYSCCISIGRGN